METSLIGKALNFGFNDYGFESRVSNITTINWNSYVLNHLKLNILKKNFYFNIVFNKTIWKVLKTLKKIGLILNYNLIFLNNVYSFQITLFFYKMLTFYKNIKLISTKNKNFFISNYMLKLLARKIGNSIYIISTNLNLITNKLALKKKIGGKIIYLCF